MYIQDNSKNLLGLLGRRKSRKIIHFDWTVGMEQPARPTAKINSHPAIELVAPTKTQSIDIVGLPLCKYCKQPIQWGEVTEAIGEDTRTGYWIPLDPDFSLHGCRK